MRNKAGLRRANSNTELGHRSIVDFVKNVAYSIVAASAALGPQSKRTEFEVEAVVDNERLRRGDTVVTEAVEIGRAAAVHKRAWLDEHNELPSILIL